MIVAWFFAFALSGLVYVIRLIHRALPYAIAGAPLGLNRKDTVALKNLFVVYYRKMLGNNVTHFSHFHVKSKLPDN